MGGGGERGSEAERASETGGPFFGSASMHHRTHTNTQPTQAAANAKENAKASKAKLVVAEAYADQGRILKRFRPRAQGRGFKIMKPTFHVTIRLAESA